MQILGGLSPGELWVLLVSLDLHCLSLSLYLRLLHRRSEVVRLLHRVNPQIMLWCIVHRRGLRKKAMSKLAGVYPGTCPTEDAGGSDVAPPPPARMERPHMYTLLCGGFHQA